ncbi:MAG TPA: class I mannose-6-phosphate isomerase [Terriglobales bacterium]|nr:class I mannose-6-phosphate isomerase [Terriglobales bacterium]
MSASAGLRVIPPRFQPRVWGQRDLSAWYPERGREPEPVGEAWLSPPGGPVLIKLLFPRQRLSVQVHPDDAYAAAHGLGRGKSEAWYVVEAEAEARLGVGLRPGARWEELEAACRAGRGAELLHWFAVAAGDVIDVPAGTVHAIGPGVVLCEVQQDSDNTFRLDDYGRGRGLHLEQGLAVARPTAGGRVETGLAAGASGLLLATGHFRLWRHCLAAGGRLAPAAETRWLVNVQGACAIPRGCAAELPPGGDLRVAAATTLLEARTGAP